MLVNYWDKYTEMHGQQNVKKKLKYMLTQNLSFVFEILQPEVL